MRYRDDMDVLFSVVDLLIDNGLVEEFKAFDGKVSLISILLLLRKHNILRKLLTILTGKDSKDVGLIDGFRAFKHYSSLYGEIKAMLNE